MSAPELEVEDLEDLMVDMDHAAEPLAAKRYVILNHLLYSGLDDSLKINLLELWNIL